MESAYLELKNAVSKIKSTQAEVNLYQDTFLVTQEKYKKGIASELTLHDVTLGYGIALFNQKQAVYDYIIAKAGFDKATGGGV